MNEKPPITMYATTWCGDCKRAKSFFERNGIEYSLVNIEEDEAAAAYVVEVNEGYQSVPTIVFPDGSILTEPTDQELKEKLNLS